MAGTSRHVPRRVPRRAVRLGTAASSKKGDFPDTKAVSDKNAASPLSSPSGAATPAKAPTASPITPHQAEPVARDPAAASTTHLSLPPHGSQRVGGDIIQSIETVIPESSTSAAKKHLLANDYSDASSNVSSPMRPLSFVSATPSLRFPDQEKKTVTCIYGRRYGRR